MFLASALTLLSASPVRTGFEPILMRWVNAIDEHGPRQLGLRYEQQRLPDVPKSKTIALIEFSRYAHATDFGGRSPLPRGCIAEALTQMSHTIDAMRSSGAPIIALDMDITLRAGEDSLGEDAVLAMREASRKPGESAVPDCVNRPQRIGPALKELAASGVTVIGLALERETTGERISRNNFIAANCSDTFTPGQGGVYFASGAVFARVAEPLYQFPALLHHGSSRKIDGVERVVLPELYPSLGNLIGAARRLHAEDRTSGEAKADREALLSACVAAKARNPKDKADALPLIDDLTHGVVGVDTSNAIVAAYKFELLNLHELGLRRRDIGVDSMAALASHKIVAPTAVLALSDGSTADLFVTPKSFDSFTPGAAIHVAASVSLHEDAVASARKMLKLIADFIAGVLFCVPILLLHHKLEARSQAWPWVQRASALLLPLFVAALVIALSFWVSALLLPRGFWLNPVYMSLGMMIHSYFDVSRPAPRRPGQALRTEAASSRFAQTLTTISDWVDVDKPPPPAERHAADKILRTLWLCLLAIVIACAVVLSISDLLSR